MRSLKTVRKVKDFTRSQLEELVRQFGGEDDGVANAMSVLRREKKIILADSPKQLFTEQGDAFFGAVSSTAHLQGVGNNSLTDLMPTPKHQIYLPRYWNAMAGKLRSFGKCDNVLEFDKMLQELYRMIEQREIIKPILQSPWCPIVLPKYGDNERSYPAVGNEWLEVLTRALTHSFPGDNVDLVKDWRPIGSEIKISAESLHQNLFSLLHRRSVLGMYFPLALRGWSAETAYEFVNELPSGFSLSGLLDTVVAGITFPDLLLGQDQYSFLMAGVECGQDNVLSIGRKRGKNCSGISFSIIPISQFALRMSPGITFIRPWKRWD